MSVITYFQRLKMLTTYNILVVIRLLPYRVFEKINDNIQKYSTLPRFVSVIIYFCLQKYVMSVVIFFRTLTTYNILVVIRLLPYRVFEKINDNIRKYSTLPRFVSVIIYFLSTKIRYVCYNIFSNIDSIQNFGLY